MDIFERCMLFPEILDTKFLVVPRVKAPTGKVIHAGVKRECPEKKNFTLEEQEVDEELRYELYDSYFKNFEFLSINQLKEFRDNFCEACLPGVGWLTREDDVNTLNDLVEAFENLALTGSEKVYSDLNFYYSLSDDATNLQTISNARLEDRSEATTIIKAFKAKFENKLNSVIKSLNSESFQKVLNDVAYDKAVDFIMKENLLNSSLTIWFEKQRKALVNDLKEDNSFVIHKNFFPLSTLKTYFSSFLKEKLNEKEALFFMQITCLYEEESSDFNVMPYHIFLAWSQISQKYFPTYVRRESHLIIIDNEPEKKIIETCKSLYDIQNSTFDTYEKVYDIAVNV